MSYYILPKNKNVVNVNPKVSLDKCSQCVSHSFLNYYLKIKKDAIEMFMFGTDLSDNSFEEATRTINPHEFIFSKVPGSKFSVSKLKPNTNLFYDLYEILNNLIFFDNLKNGPIKSLHISPNYNDSIESFGMIRDEYEDTNITFSNLDINNELSENYFDYIFYDTNSFNEQDYFISLVKTIITILKNQKYNGNIIIKIKDILHKPVIDCVYFLTSLFDKVYIAKPTTNNITSPDRYIVCKSFQYNENTRSYLKLNSTRLIGLIKTLGSKNIIDILGNDISYYFKNKIDEINIIIGQQQLDALDQIIFLYKNKTKNKNEKIENIQKSNIQKSVNWCEKYRIPCNKFTEKINIFLPIINEPIQA